MANRVRRSFHFSYYAVCCENSVDIWGSFQSNLYMIRSANALQDYSECDHQEEELSSFLCKNRLNWEFKVLHLHIIIMITSRISHMWRMFESHIWLLGSREIIIWFLCQRRRRFLFNAIYNEKTACLCFEQLLEVMIWCFFGPVRISLVWFWCYISWLPQVSYLSFVSRFVKVTIPSLIKLFRIGQMSDFVIKCFVSVF